MHKKKKRMRSISESQTDDCFSAAVFCVPCGSPRLEINVEDDLILEHSNAQHEGAP